MRPDALLEHVRKAIATIEIDVHRFDAG